ncbi:MAG: hypothetical protein MH252_11325 [Thermosynechococcaceae cyanobacterium MS004]|nr:hypothetical protein [Thermosynechococcaceae cyanobacterium MS004]
MSNPTATLIELRRHYEQIIAQAEYQTTQAKAQLEHIDALLLNGILQRETPTLDAIIDSDLPALAPAAISDFPDLSPVPSGSKAADPKPPSSKTKAANKVAKTKETQTKETQTKETQTKKIKATETPKSTIPTASNSSDSLSLLPSYAGLTKLQAISKVLTEQSGHVLHQDSIIQLLYGDLSPEALSLERRRMRASLFQGVKKNLWQRAEKAPSSYIVKSGGKSGVKLQTKRQSKTSEADAIASRSNGTQNKPGRKPKAENATGPVKSPSRGRDQVLPLPAEYEGLSKIDAVAAILSEHPGTIVHINDLIQRLYGTLTGEDLKAEKVRMKDVMTRGIRRSLWTRAVGVPSSYVIQGDNPAEKPKTTQTDLPIGQTAAGAATPTVKSPGRKSFGRKLKPDSQKSDGQPPKKVTPRTGLRRKRSSAAE